MSLFQWTVFCLMSTQIQGFDIGRKLWNDLDKPDGLNTEMSGLGSNMDGRNQPSLKDDNMDDIDSLVPQSYLSRDTQGDAGRGLSSFRDDENDLDGAVKSELAKDVSLLAGRKMSPFDTEEQDIALRDEEAFELTGNLPGVVKRNSFSILDLLNDIMKKQNKMQEQIDALQGGKKLESCPDGWYTYGKSCYYFSRHTSSWFDAMSSCVWFQGYLVEVNDKSENDYLKRKAAYFGGIFYLGGTDMIKENHWIWAHSQTPMTTSTFQDWKKGEPNGDDEHCLTLEPSGFWHDVKCYRNEKYICERELK